MPGKSAAQKSFDRLVRLAKKLKLEDVTSDKASHGAPALRVHDRPFVHIKEAGVMVLHCPLEAKDMLKRRIDEAAKYVPLENLCLSPQCGFASTYLGNKITEDVQKQKLELVVQIATEIWGSAQ